MFSFLMLICDQWLSSCLQNWLKVFHATIDALLSLSPLKYVIARHAEFNILLYLRLLFPGRIWTRHDTGGHVNFLTLLLDLCFFVLPVTIRLTLSDLFQNVLNWRNTFIVWQGVLAEHLSLWVSFMNIRFHEQVLFVDCLKFVAEKEEVVHPQVTYFKVRLDGLGFKHSQERQCTR